MGTEKDNLDNLLKKIDEAGPSKTRSGAYYSPEGDCVFAFREDVPYFAERVDDLLTVFRSEDDKRIIGLQIKWI